MGKVETMLVQAVAESGEVVGINVPVGPIVEPRPELQALVAKQYDPANWKMPLKPFVTHDRDLAHAYADAVDFYVGGHEWAVEAHYAGRQRVSIYTITSEGYYHYVGA